MGVLEQRLVAPVVIYTVSETRRWAACLSVGVEWGVPYAMLTLADPAAAKVAGKVVIPVVPVGMTRLKYS